MREGSTRGSGGRRPGQAGLTLVELLVALGIFAFGATAVLGLLAAGAGIVREARARTEAGVIAHSAFAEVRGRLRARLDVAALPRAAGGGGGGRAGWLLWSDRRHGGAGGWRSDLVLYPVDDEDPERAELFHAELRLRTRRRGRERTVLWHAAVCRRVRALDLEPTAAE